MEFCGFWRCPDQHTSTNMRTYVELFLATPSKNHACLAFQERNPARGADLCELCISRDKYLPSHNRKKHRTSSSRLFDYESGSSSDDGTLDLTPGEELDVHGYSGGTNTR